jgi:hypothetical protein
VSAQRKPRDIGNGLVCASFGSAGEWLSLATVDQDAGFAELTGLPLFDPQLRTDPDAVFRYRSWMRREEHAFLRVEAGRATLTTREDAPRGTRAVIQRLTLRAPRRLRPPGVRIRFSGRLAAPTLADPREVDPPVPETAAVRGRLGATPPGVARSRVKAREGTLRVSGHGAPVVIQAWLRKPGGSGEASAAGGATEGRSDRRLAWTIQRRVMPTAVAWIEWPVGAEELHLDIACSFDRGPLALPEWLAGAGSGPPAEEPAEARGARPGPEIRTGRSGVESRPLRVPARLVRAIGQIDQRAAAYVRTCTALQVLPGERCLLADHRILPLSWTHDGYWQARLLLASWSRGGHDEDAAIVADHLRWLFLRCERPDGRWVRTHHADGRRRDHRVRADQQLYPLLELTDHALALGGLPLLPPGHTWAELVQGAWAAVESAIDPASGLLATDEDAADEPAPHPFLAAHQVLLWLTATRLAGLARQLGLSPAPFSERAESTRAAFEAHVLVDGPLGRQWAGSVDGRGAALRHVDATDLPIALAPLWGFCRPSDAAWRATIAFAFDRTNPCFVPGVAGGLGSRRTPGTWTLGDVFAWAAFGQMGDHETSEAVLARLVRTAFQDGMLPEAYDPQGSGAIVRHWFALPGAVLGALVLDHAARASAG